MIRRPPRSTQSRSSAASDVYKRQCTHEVLLDLPCLNFNVNNQIRVAYTALNDCNQKILYWTDGVNPIRYYNIDTDETITDCGQLSLMNSVSYTHLRAHETVLDLVCRLLLEKKKQKVENRVAYRLVLNNTWTDDLTLISQDKLCSNILSLICTAISQLDTIIYH